MSHSNGVTAVLEATEALDLAPRGDRWCHLSLCVIDAVYSLNATYTTTVQTVRRYGRYAELGTILAPAASVARGDIRAAEESLETFLERAGSMSAEDLAANVFENRQMTSPRGGVRKAQAVVDYARILSNHGVNRLSDVPALLGDPTTLKDVERQLSGVRGHGSGIRVSYLWMLAGSDDDVKPDRMVLSWLRRVVGSKVEVAEAVDLVREAAHELAVTPWVLDHAIWRFERDWRLDGDAVGGSATQTLTLDDAESRLQAAQRAGDVAALDALLHPDAVYLGPDGSETSREADLEAHRSGLLKLSAVEELSRSVAEFGDTGVTRVRVHLVGEAGGQPIDAVLVYSRTWVRTDGAWRVVQAHGAVVG